MMTATVTTQQTVINASVMVEGETTNAVVNINTIGVIANVTLAYGVPGANNFYTKSEIGDVNFDFVEFYNNL